MRFLLALCLIFSTPAWAGDYEDAAREALEWIGENTDYNVDVPLPGIRLVTQEDLMVVYYGRLPGENEVFLEVMAIYQDGPPVEIWVRDDFDLNSDDGRHTLVHELVHHLQYVSGREFACIGKMEAEAYALSDLYAVEVLQNESLKSDPLVMIFISDCGRGR